MGQGRRGGKLRHGGLMFLFNCLLLLWCKAGEGMGQFMDCYRTVLAPVNEFLWCNSNIFYINQKACLPLLVTKFDKGLGERVLATPRDVVGWVVDCFLLDLEKINIHTYSQSLQPPSWQHALGLLYLQ